MNGIKICQLCKGCPAAWTITQGHLMGRCSIRKDNVHQGSDYYEGRVLCPDFDMSDEGYLKFKKMLPKIALLIDWLVEKVVE
jgi:hypothetical protein